MAKKKKPALKGRTRAKAPGASKKKKAGLIPGKPRKPAVKKASPRRKGAKPTGLPELQRDAALKILDDRQAKDIVTVDVRGRSVLTDYVIIASGRSARHLAAMAGYLRDALEKAGANRTRAEGLPQGDWVLVDAGDVLVHLFRPEVRRYYNIDDLWARRPGG